jgi:hypothetical protein
MAASGFTPISLYYSSTAAAVPLAANLVAGELSLNTNDGKLYYKNSSSVVTLLASTSGASGDVVGPASSTDNALARFDLATGKLIQNSVGILSDAGILTGLTGITSSGPITLSSLTSGRVPYATTAGLLTDSANLTFNGTTLTANTIGAFTLSGTVAGGGNQINNVIIGTSTPLAGAFTTLNASTSITNYGLTSGRVVYSTTGGLETDSANLLYAGKDLTVYGIRVGRGAGEVSTNLVVGASSLDNASLSGGFNIVVGVTAARGITTGSENIAIGSTTLTTLSTGTRNVAVGNNAMQYSTGDYNTVVGMLAGNNNTGSNNSFFGYQALGTSTASSHSNGVAVGFQAMYSNTGYAGQVAVGYQALYTGGGGNETAIGYRALYSTTASGGVNTAVGYEAINRPTNAIRNVAVGYRAMYGGVSSTPSDSVAVGNEALVAITTGANNVAIGGAALATLTTVSNQVAIGYQAGYLRSTGADNYSTVMIGNLAGYSTATGTDNTYIGGYAARYQTGSFNTAIGGGALYGASGTSTGSNNTAVGYGSSAAITTGTNNTAVGYGAFSGNSTGSFNTALGREALSGTTNDYNIGIGLYAGRGNSPTGQGANLSIGAYAGYSLTSGHNNTFVGGTNPSNYGSAGGSVTSGYFNTFIGRSAGGVVTSGSTNTFIGWNAGGSVTLGASNTIIGGYSGNQSSLDLRTASNSIVLSDGDGNPQFYILYNASDAASYRIRNANHGFGYIFAQGTLAAAGSVAVNANGTGGDGSIGNLGVMTRWTSVDGGDSTAIFIVAHGQAYNTFTEQQKTEQNGITITLAAGLITIVNGSANQISYQYVYTIFSTDNLIRSQI